MRRYAHYVNGEFGSSSETMEIVNPFSGSTCALAPKSDHIAVEKAIESACRSATITRKLPAYERSDQLLGLRDALQRRRTDFEQVIVEEAGKAIRDARVEVDRALNVLVLCAEEAKRIGGDFLPLDQMHGSERKFGITRRFPVGPLLAISPYNFPLNLGLHKVGPAIACGNPVIWKPSLLAPGAAFLFAELIEEVGCPAGAIQVITPNDTATQKIACDNRIRMVSFTGSARIGWMLRSVVGDKRITLELGGNAAVIVCEDADLSLAVARCVSGGFAYSGQVCISVQRILVHSSLMECFCTELVAGVKNLVMGNPISLKTQIGPMVSDKEADRIHSWIVNAVDDGATLLTGGTRNGRMIAPTVLRDVSHNQPLYREEAFGPVVIIESFDDFGDAIDAVNSSRYGLQAGIFTKSMDNALLAFRDMDVGGLIVNDIPSYRTDSMPYGGIKDSGLGREGIKYAIDEMMEQKLMVMTFPE